MVILKVYVVSNYLLVLLQPQTSYSTEALYALK